MPEEQEREGLDVNSHARMPITRNKHCKKQPDGFHLGYFFNYDYALPLPERSRQPDAILGIKLTAHKAASAGRRGLSTLYSSHSFKLNGRWNHMDGRWSLSEFLVRENRCRAAVGYRQEVKIRSVTEQILMNAQSSGTLPFARIHT